ncbi:hypothetical protein GCM10010510_68540 [Streptomyces anandii JCM 4720]|nr:FKBP-type peptidyl-prolyl cis-trans isomerase [Streptomyces anandii]GGY12743.1 hypothetical protein GCM10010510_68540 [Streptomyces anandii JCM 4720]
MGRATTLPALDRAVQGRRAGSRVLVVAPPAAAYGSDGNPKSGVKGTDTVVFVVDVLSIVRAHATVDGDQAGVPDSLPQVRVDRRSATATIAVPDRKAPGRLVKQTLTAGPGPVVRAGRQVVLQQSTAVWQQGRDDARLVMSSQAGGGPLPS